MNKDDFQPQEVILNNPRLIEALFILTHTKTLEDGHAFWIPSYPPHYFLTSKTRDETVVGYDAVGFHINHTNNAITQYYPELT